MIWTFFKVINVQVKAYRCLADCSLQLKCKHMRLHIRKHSLKLKAGVLKPKYEKMSRSRSNNASGVFIETTSLFNLILKVLWYCILFIIHPTSCIFLYTCTMLFYYFYIKSLTDCIYPRNCHKPKYPSLLFSFLGINSAWKLHMPTSFHSPLIRLTFISYRVSKRTFPFQMLIIYLIFFLIKLNQVLLYSYYVKKYSLFT